MSWHDAKAYCAWLSEQTGEEYDLPTSEQWEYAARAGSATAYPWGNEFDEQYAHCDAHQTIPVWDKLPNKWGLYQMCGNVWEWCNTEA